MTSTVQTKMIDGLMLRKEDAVLKNMKLVRKVCHKYDMMAKVNGLEFQDLENIGVIGLLRAYDAYDSTGGAKFGTYAYTKILAQLQRYFEENSRGPRFSVNVIQIGKSIKRYNLEHLSDEELMEKYNLGQERLRMVRDYLRGIGTTLSLDAENDVQKPGGSKSDIAGLHEALPVYVDMTNIFVEEFMAKLSDKERKVVIASLNGRTNKEIANTMGVTDACVRFWKKQLRIKLTNYMVS
ncbi:sigma-70 family RNA polymerase sigma factor [Sutcliffiella horikoshii]|uniref:Sigma-70 family RNA polymerase sigma factor n=1 Tax=Sutcliffiella horikoshii TaxID=79883 RepID=A0A5D4SA65_9BACI|nr:sigma-70 family RNA polymerase sigma factor [Sutcliffiella horikoshii]TYS60503.1 sigma-70 family RNA polymerase sigma factor [Sutcliffiella horikoshii]